MQTLQSLKASASAKKNKQRGLIYKQNERLDRVNKRKPRLNLFDRFWSTCLLAEYNYFCTTHILEVQTLFLSVVVISEICCPHLQIRQHAQQTSQQTSVHSFTTSFSFNQQKDSINSLVLNLLITNDMVSK